MLEYPHRLVPDLDYGADIADELTVCARIESRPGRQLNIEPHVVVSSFWALYRDLEMLAAHDKPNLFKNVYVGHRWMC